MLGHARFLIHVEVYKLINATYLSSLLALMCYHTRLSTGHKKDEMEAKAGVTHFNFKWINIWICPSKTFACPYSKKHNMQSDVIINKWYGLYRFNVSTKS